MRRTCVEPSFSIVPPARKVLFEGTVHVVTPMFGGSATAGEVDPERPVNAKMIRGHLRFWWRACRAGKFQDAGEMFAEETKIWGSTDTPSAVDVHVETLSAGARVACAHYDKRPDGTYRSFPTFRPGYPSYALFPFQGKAGRSVIETKPLEAHEKVQFVLRLSASQSNTSLSESDLDCEVKAALWAWLLFGGVGARTRRGCGSLYVAGWPFDDLQKNAAEAIGAQASHYVDQGACSLPIPSLKGARLIVIGSKQPHLQAWGSAINKMRDFRQGVGVGRNQGAAPNRPGRSKWPEPDSIREATHRSSPGHQPQHPAQPYYPRADLGMPIVFHFKDEFNGDPHDTILGPTEDGRTRMASPAILKPLAVSTTHSLPMALMLNAPHVWDPDVPQVGLSGGRAVDAGQLHDPQKSTRVKPLQDHGKDNAREAFMEFFKRGDSGAKEVKL